MTTTQPINGTPTTTLPAKENGADAPPREWHSPQVSCAVITATSPAVIAKQFRMIDGKLHQTTTANLTDGRVEVREFANLADFAQLLQGLSTAQALTYGLPIEHPARIVTKEAWHKAGMPRGSLPRARDTFKYAEGRPGVMFLDFDVSQDATASYDREALVNAVRTAAPGLKAAPMLWWPSSSSHVYQGDEDLTGLRGQRLYILVHDAVDIPRAGKALVEYLWAAGYGHFEVSKSGSLLDRTLVDATVWQGNRLDFAAGAHCIPPLTQRRGSPVHVLGDGPEIVDTRIAIPDPSPEVLAVAETRRAEARAAVEPERIRVRAAYIETRAAEIVEKMSAARREGAMPEALLDEARDQVVAALDGGALWGDWTLTFVDGNTATVAQVLDNPAKYHGCLTRDPIEPDYDGGRAVGKLYLYGRARLHSFAHGGRTFRLHRPPREIELEAGNERGAVDALLDIMRTSSEFFDFGDILVTVGDDGSVQPCTPGALRYYVGGLVRFFQWRRPKNAAPFRVFLNPPDTLLRSVHDLGRGRRLRALRGVLTAPTLRPDGSVLDRPGFDAETGLLLLLPEHGAVEVPVRPTIEQCRGALETLWQLFAQFPFVEPVDAGVHLAALLTAVIRRTLPTAPAFAYDAPVQGSGKTLIARTVAALCSGSSPAVTPHIGGKGDDEVRKRLFALLLEGAPYVVWDNVIGQFDSASLAGFLTSERYKDRDLGRSRVSEVPNTAIFLMTGNNLRFAGDLPRRVLVSRIDPKVDAPMLRRFDVNPLTQALARRQALVAAALTLLRGWLMSGVAEVGGSLASFEQWDALVRQAVAWIARAVDEDGRFADPADAVVTAVSFDPVVEELAELHDAWHAVYGSSEVRAADIAGLAEELATDYHDQDDPKRRLVDAVRELIANRNAALSAKAIGKALSFRKDRRNQGRWLRCRTGRDGIALWSLQTDRELAAGSCRVLQGLESSTQAVNEDSSSCMDLV